MSTMTSKYYACQVYEGGPEAAESGKTWTQCKNHPGHENFIPVTKFGMEHLPEQCRTPYVLEMVKTLALLTVKLFVRHANKEREQGYCFHHNSQSGGHVGSGWITDVKKGYGCCFEKDCPHYCDQSLCNGWYKIFVVTAVHVVYDSGEGSTARVDLFYDDEESRKDGRMKSISGVDVFESDKYQDYCIVSCKTHDESFAHQLMGYVEQMKNMLVNQKGENQCNSEQESPEDQNSCIIVSHPHGQPKMITVGHRQKDKGGFRDVNKVVRSELRRQAILTRPILYTTETCPGSSGAPVFMPLTVETRQNTTSREDALVIRAHSIGGVLAGVGLSAGIAPLEVQPPLALPTYENVTN